MKKLNTVVNIMEKFASPELARFDYVGLLQGDLRAPIKKIGLTLDYSLLAIEQAVEKSCDLLITHHGPTSIRYPLVGNNLHKISLASQANMAVYRSHLSLDFCVGGIIDTLCDSLKIPAEKTSLVYEGTQIYGGVNLAKHYPLTLRQLKERISGMGIDQIRIAGVQKEKFSRIAVTSGQGFFGEFMDQLKPEVYIAGEFEQEATKYAEDLGIMLVELGHHASEARVLEKLIPKLGKVFNLPVQFIEIPDTIQIVKTKESV